MESPQTPYKEALGSAACSWLLTLKSIVQWFFFSLMILLFKLQSSSEKSNSWQKIRLSLCFGLCSSVSARKCIFPPCCSISDGNQAQGEGKCWTSVLGYVHILTHTPNELKWAKKWWIGNLRTRIDLKFFIYVWLSVEKEKMGENECEPADLSAKDAFELEMGHIFFWAFRELMLVSCVSLLPACFALSWSSPSLKVFPFKASFLIYLPLAGKKISYMEDKLKDCS